MLFSYSREEYEEEFDEEYNEPINNLAKCEFDFSMVPFLDINALIQFVDDNPCGAINEDELVYGWIA